jgi:hypothetical protein
MERGRPTSYKPEYCQMLIDHMGQGFSFMTFAAIIEVNPDSLYEWAKVHEDFSEAKKIGYAKLQLLYEKIGRDGMLGKIKNFNAATWIFSCKNKFNWVDAQETTIKGDANLTHAYLVKLMQEAPIEPTNQAH